MAESDTPCAVPLLELMRSVPVNAKLVIETDFADDGRCIGHRSIPVGRYLHEAAAALTAAEARAAAGEKDAQRWRCLRETPCTITFDETVTFKTPNGGGQVIHVRMIGNTELDTAIDTRLSPPKANT